MLAAARKYKRVVQIGTQRRSTPHLIEARELVKEGKLGTIGHGDSQHEQADAQLGRDDDR